LTITITLVYDRIRWEEKEILKAIENRGLTVLGVDAKELILDSSRGSKDITQEFGTIVLQRCVSHFRGLHIASFLEAKGSRVINSSEVSRICGNKYLTTLSLEKGGSPTPTTLFAFSGPAAKKAADAMGYPSVLKPIVGSWGRGVARLNDKESASALIEMREDSNGLFNQIYYIQKHIHRPPRDIRTVVIGDELISANYRYSQGGDWRTNVSRGGKIELCKITPELEDIVLKAAQGVGGGILGVDAMEGPEGLVVHEVNNNVEFRGASQVSPVNIPAKIVDHLLLEAKR
jgi:[lysine-biosynthesis-protein LysW]--L-2-aminoadipate ligase